MVSQETLASRCKTLREMLETTPQPKLMVAGRMTVQGRALALVVGLGEALGRMDPEAYDDAVGSIRIDHDGSELPEIDPDVLQRLAKLKRMQDQMAHEAQAAIGAPAQAIAPEDKQLADRANGH